MPYSFSFLLNALGASRRDTYVGGQVSTPSLPIHLCVTDLMFPVSMFRHLFHCLTIALRSAAWPQGECLLFACLQLSYLAVQLVSVLFLLSLPAVVLLSVRLLRVRVHRAAKEGSAIDAGSTTSHSKEESRDVN